MVSAAIRHLVRDVDRHGRVRLYVRNLRSRRKIRIRAELGTPEFWRAYEAAIAALFDPTAEAAAAHPAKSTLGGLVTRYYASAEFRALDARTQYVRRRLLERFCAHGKQGSAVTAAALPYQLMEPRHIVERCDALTQGPEGRNGMVKALRQLFRWACAPHVGLARDNPAARVPYLRPTNPDGFHTWSVAEVEQFQARWPAGTKPYLALSLLLFTGARRSDVVRLGRQHIRDGWIRWPVFKGRRQKHKEIAVPVLAALDHAITAGPTGDLTFLSTAFDRPYTAAGFGSGIGFGVAATKPGCPTARPMASGRPGRPLPPTMVRPSTSLWRFTAGTARSRPCATPSAPIVVAWPASQ